MSLIFSQYFIQPNHLATTRGRSIDFAMGKYGNPISTRRDRNQFIRITNHLVRYDMISSNLFGRMFEKPNKHITYAHIRSTSSSHPEDTSSSNIFNIQSSASMKKFCHTIQHRAILHNNRYELKSSNSSRRNMRGELRKQPQTRPI